MYSVYLFVNHVVARAYVYVVFIEYVERFARAKNVKSDNLKFDLWQENGWLNDDTSFVN